MNSRYTNYKARLLIALVASLSLGISAQAATVTTAKSTYHSNEDIVVKYAGFPGSNNPGRDWITVVPKANQDDKYGEWQWTDQTQAGTLTFKQHLPEGPYEVRGYFNWSDGGYNVMARYAFTVSDPGGTVKTAKSMYHSNEDIVVTYAGFPGSSNHGYDWITVAPKTNQNDKYGEWQKTDQTPGTLTFKHLPEGPYEVRGYFNWSDGGYNVKARYQFSVSDPKEWRPIDLNTERYGLKDTGNGELLKKFEKAAQNFLDKAAPEVAELTKRVPKVFSTNAAVDVFVTYGCINTLTNIVVKDIKPVIIELPDKDALSWWTTTEDFARKEPERDKAIKRNTPRTGCS